MLLLASRPVDRPKGGHVPASVGTHRGHGLVVQKDPCSMLRTSALAAAVTASAVCACAITSRPRRRASSTSAASSSSVGPIAVSSLIDRIDPEAPTLIQFGAGPHHAPHGRPGRVGTVEHRSGNDGSPTRSAVPRSRHRQGPRSATAAAG
ncbi:hypothetical protein [Amycolatopsis sp.]|uniref:hypothetical protein n=1 Tax=Amycolatopsis sp. TaxID=37632 RepID=UPI002C30B29A|nr:hypothetical protein [Amycolatopsis sp.]HVV13983.1 hypothetical protein [Amycolatopsis sp.]